MLGAPAFLYRELAQSGWRWLTSVARFDTGSAFYWENRWRYLYSYLRERRRSRAAVAGAATAPVKTPEHRTAA